MDAVRQSMSRCPFLRNVAGTNGEAFAEHIAVQPEQSFRGSSYEGPARCPLAGLRDTFRKFHDPEVGVVPLQEQRVADVENRFNNGGLEAFARQRYPAVASSAAGAAPVGQPPCPFASISLGLPGPDHFFRRWLRQRRLDKQAQRHRQSGGTSSNAGQPGAQGTSKSGPIHGHSNGPGGRGTACTSGRPPGLSIPRSKQQKKLPHGGRPGYWKKYGPLGGLVPLGAKGELACPPAIVAARAFVAGLPPVQELRPKALHIKMASIALVAAAANIPFGAWREHFDKFSPGWFVAVHATIPFIALLRKGVVMPRWAILLTITGALAGQTIGSRLERRRLAALSESSDQSDSFETTGQRHASRPSPVAALAMVPQGHWSSPYSMSPLHFDGPASSCSRSSLQGCHAQESLWGTTSAGPGSAPVTA